LLQNLGTPVTSGAEYFTDPTAPGGKTDTVYVSGGNPALRPQTAHSVSTGFDLKPVGIPQWTLSATYFHTTFTNRIQSPPLNSASIFVQPLLTPFIVRNPSIALVESYFDSSGFGSDATTLGPAGVKAIVYEQLANIASVTESGFDVSTRYRQETPYGVLDFVASGTRLLDERFKSTSASPTFELINTIGEPTAWKARGGPGWTLGGFTATLNVNYVNSYSNNLLSTPEKVAAWTTEDLFLGYHFDAASSLVLLRDLSLSLSVLNLTDAAPPHVLLPLALYSAGQNQLPYDSTNASPVGRFISFQVTKRWY
jgi:hypothetical protein